jgi:hypothetical protein
MLVCMVGISALLLMARALCANRRRWVLPIEPKSTIASRFAPS